MSRWAYVNGQYLPKSQATVHVEDRGYQFADAVYEVWAVMGGRLADFEGHMARLERSLAELRIRMPMSRAALTQVLRETVRRNRVRDGLVYLQISRGTAPRDHAFPSPDTPPSVVVTAKSIDRRKQEAAAARGAAVVTRPDDRWGRRPRRAAPHGRCRRWRRRQECGRRRWPSARRPRRRGVRRRGVGC